MIFSQHSLVFLISITSFATAISTSNDDGYTGYNLEFEGDKRSVVYDTADTTSNVSALTSPDVYLNASLSVGEISILVANLTAKVNLDAQVLNLLSFNAGVTASIDRVSLVIQKISARVILEARLENLVLMISDVLDSIDLNPIIASLSNDVGEILNTTTTAVGGLTSGLTARSYNLEHNILYSINDYSGKTHTNRVLAQNGDILDEFLDNEGIIHKENVVGSYLTDMTYNGYNRTTTFAGKLANELEYVYAPFVGSSIVSAVFVDGNGTVIGTQVLSESSAGGSSTVSDL